MKHESKISAIIVRTEFEAYGRTAYVETEVTSMAALTNPLALRAAIDAHIENFFRTTPDPRLPQTIN